MVSKERNDNKERILGTKECERVFAFIFFVVMVVV
jgi:hypothetical protein